MMKRASVFHWFMTAKSGIVMMEWGVGWKERFFMCGLAGYNERRNAHDALPFVMLMMRRWFTDRRLKDASSSWTVSLRLMRCP